MSNLQQWKKDMKRENPKPKKGSHYTLNDQLYLRTDDDLWHRLSAVEVINMYMADTDGGIPPEMWLNKFKSEQTLKREGDK